MLSQIASATFEQGQYFFEKQVAEQHISDYIRDLPGAIADPEEVQKWDALYRITTVRYWLYEIMPRLNLTLPAATMLATSSRFIIRQAAKADVPALFRLIQALANYEQLSHAVTGDSTSLEVHLFGANPCIEALIAECAEDAVGFALFFQTYSTFLTQPGMYLEDLFVLSEYRGLGIGKALLAQVAKIALQRGCGRFEWAVLDWNDPAIAFYKRMGAEVLPDWRICRVSSDRLAELGNL